MGRGALFVVGIGPGKREHMTLKAMEVIGGSEVVLGYGPYLSMVEDLLEGKEVEPFGMGEEVARASRAVELALRGRRVSLLSGGDATVYGMASLALELALGAGVEVEVVPGVTAALAASALLGAPLGHDVAFVSLSDLLTPWETIEGRLRGAGMGDFVVCLYNPGSRGRRDRLRRACEVLSLYRSPSTPCGVVKNAMREEGQEVLITDLEGLSGMELDMSSLAVVGSSATKVVDGRLITPRGYRV